MDGGPCRRSRRPLRRRVHRINLAPEACSAGVNGTGRATARDRRVRSHVQRSPGTRTVALSILLPPPLFAISGPRFPDLPPVRRYLHDPFPFAGPTDVLLHRLRVGRRKILDPQMTPRQVPAHRPSVSKGRPALAILASTGDAELLDPTSLVDAEVEVPGHGAPSLASTGARARSSVGATDVPVRRCTGIRLSFNELSSPPTSAARGSSRAIP